MNKSNNPTLKELTRWNKITHLLLNQRGKSTTRMRS